jgi:Ser/Thr protein kinase RdoA (MazF antagonist)
VTDDAVVGRLLDEYRLRGVRPGAVRRLRGSERGPRVTYLVPLGPAAAAVVRAYRGDTPVPRHAGGAGSSVADWLPGRALLLQVLASAGYPAPRPVRTRTGELVGIAGPWLTWAVSYQPGPALTGTLPSLRLMGRTLGRLHATALGPAADACGPVSGDPVAVVSRLDDSRQLTPSGLSSLHAELLSIAATVAAAGPALGARTVLHGAPHPGNAIHAGPDAVTLVGWQAAGLGWPVLDLGHGLLACCADGIRPDRIGALVAGYFAARRPSPAEVALLPLAVRWPTVIAGVTLLDAVAGGGLRGAPVEARIASVRRSLAVADAVAAAADHAVRRAGS